MDPTRRSGTRSALHAVANQAADFIESLPTRHVGARATPAELLRALDPSEWREIEQAAENESG
jgi:hypothetical protein